MDVADIPLPEASPVQAFWLTPCTKHVTQPCIQTSSPTNSSSFWLSGSDLGGDGHGPEEDADDSNMDGDVFAEGGDAAEDWGDEGEWGHGDEGGESEHGEDDPVIEQNANPPQPTTDQKSSNHPQDFC